MTRSPALAGPDQARECGTRRPSPLFGWATFLFWRARGVAGAAPGREGVRGHEDPRVAGTGQRAGRLTGAACSSRPASAVHP